MLFERSSRPGRKKEVMHVEVRCHCGKLLGYKEPLDDRRISTGICADCFEAERRDNARRLALVRAAFGSIQNFRNGGGRSCCGNAEGVRARTSA